MSTTTYDIGECPFVVRTEEDAERAGKWAAEQIEKVLAEAKAQATEGK